MSKMVLIVDDDPLVRLISEKMMGALDSTLTFVPCENGEVGLERLNACANSSSECIVLLDLNMPVMDGWGFLDGIDIDFFKNNKTTSIYILSSSTDKKDIQKAKQYSVVKEFYHKPLSIPDISEILNS